MQLSQYMQNRNLCSFDINRLNLLHSDPATSWELSDSNPDTPFITWWGVALHRSRQDRSPRTGWGGSATCRRPTVHHHTHTTLFHFLDIFPFNPEIFYTLGHNDPILLCAFSKKGRYCVHSNPRAHGSMSAYRTLNSWILKKYVKTYESIIVS